MKPSTTTPLTPVSSSEELVPRPYGRWHWPSVNITPIERIGRVVFGVVAVIAGALLLASAASAVAVVLEALLIAAGLDLAVTGTLGHCPLYVKLGHVPKSLRRLS